MQLSQPEILLALRSPDSGWLGVLITMLDEAVRDPRFDASQREILQQLLDARALAPEIGDAARKRAGAFEAQILDESMLMHAPKVARDGENAAQRPKLTLVGNATG